MDSSIFYTNNIKVAKQFYLDLGFNFDYEQSGKFVSFKFDNGVRFGIKQKMEEREMPGSQTIFVSADDIHGFYANIKTSGKYNISKELVSEGWAENFSILDPDGNKIQFIERH